MPPIPRDAEAPAALLGLTGPERRAAMLLLYGTGGDVTVAAAKARELAPRDPAEARLLALMDLLGPAAAKAVVAGSPLGARLANALVATVEALDKHRGKGRQVVTVRHVHVHPGGQAVVGVVDRGRGDGAGIAHRSLGPCLAHEPRTAVQGEVEADRAAVQGAGDAREAGLPDPRRAGRRARGAAERRVEARPVQPSGDGGEGNGPAAAAVGEG